MQQEPGPEIIELTLDALPYEEPPPPVTPKSKPAFAGGGRPVQGTMRKAWSMTHGDSSEKVEGTVIDRSSMAAKLAATPVTLPEKKKEPEKPAAAAPASAAKEPPKAADVHEALAKKAKTQSLESLQRGILQPPPIKAWEGDADDPDQFGFLNGAGSPP